MKTLLKLERKYGKYAIKNLSKYIIICFSIGYFLNIFVDQVYYSLVFSPFHIFYKHEYWRLFTWIFTVPDSFNFFTLVMLFFYYSIGNSVERSIGSFMYNLYVFSGMLLTGIGCFIVGAIQYSNVAGHLGDDITKLNGEALSFVANSYANGSVMTHYMLIGIFLGFALIQSNAMVLLYFLIPFKVSWLAYIDLIFMSVEFCLYDNAYIRVCIGSILLVFLIMNMVMNKYAKMAYNRAYLKATAKVKRKNSGSDEKGQVIQMPTSITRHKCAVCGRSERDDPELEFRFCSKCNGNYEYCNEHLYTHEHVK